MGKPNVTKQIQKEYKKLTQKGFEGNELIEKLEEKFVENIDEVDLFLQTQGMEYVDEEETEELENSDDDWSKEHKFEETSYNMNENKPTLDKFAQIQEVPENIRKSLCGFVLVGTKWVKKHDHFATTKVIEAIVESVRSYLPCYGIITKQKEDQINFPMQITYLNVIDILEDSLVMNVTKFNILKNVLLNNLVQIKGMVVNGTGFDFFSGNITGNYEYRTPNGEKVSGFEIMKDGETLARV